MKKYIISVALLAVTFSVVSCRKNAATLPKGNSEKQEEVIIDGAVETQNIDAIDESDTTEGFYDNSTQQEEILDSYDDKESALDTNEEALTPEDAEINYNSDLE